MHNALAALRISGMSESDSVMVGNGEFLPITHTGLTSIASTSGHQEGSVAGKKH